MLFININLISKEIPSLADLEKFPLLRIYIFSEISIVIDFVLKLFLIFLRCRLKKDENFKSEKILSKAIL